MVIENISVIIWCSIIAFFAIINLFCAGWLTNFYRKRINDINKIIQPTAATEQDEKEQKTASEGMVSEIVETYRHLSAGSGTAEIDVEQLIRSKEPRNIVRMDAIVSVTQPSLVVIGLLGTFFGLVGAISDVSVMVSDNLGGNADISQFFNTFKEPLKQMSLAFITSIAGLASNFLLNLIHIFLYRNTTQRTFYEQMQLALESTIRREKQIQIGGFFKSAAEGLAKEYSQALKESMDRFSTSMMSLTREMSGESERINTLAKNVETLIDNINDPIARLQATVEEFNKGNRMLDIYINHVDDVAVNFKQAFMEAVQSLEASNFTQGLQRLEHVLQVNQSLGNLDQTIESINSGLPKTIDKMDTLVDNSGLIMTKTNDYIGKLTETTEEIGDVVVRSMEQVLEKGLLKNSKDVATHLSKELSRLEVMGSIVKEMQQTVVTLNRMTANQLKLEKNA